VPRTFRMEEKSGILDSRLQIIAHMCTIGPSLPTDRPPANANINPRTLATNVLKFKNRLISMPDNIALHSGIPDPARTMQREFIRRAFHDTVVSRNCHFVLVTDGYSNERTNRLRWER
jgi:hypothetical protein